MRDHEFLKSEFVRVKETIVKQYILNLLRSEFTKSSYLYTGDQGRISKLITKESDEGYVAPMWSLHGGDMEGDEWLV